MGDPSGVGPALIVKGIRRLPKDAEYIVIGDKGVLRKLGPLPARLVDLANVDMAGFRFGVVHRDYGRASVEYIDEALKLISGKQADCLVTCPISKQAIHEAGFPFPGHTGYLAEKAEARHTVMLLMNARLKVALVTQHVALSLVSRTVTPELVRETISTTVVHLRQVWGIQRPRLVVCALNPHASDHGLIGNEEGTIIGPAVAACRRMQADITGPVAADAALYQASRGDYDCAVAMYHDQALIPLKISGGDSGVNMTAGLPYIRTSPLHGTAFDRAGKLPLVSEESFVESVRVAVRCCRRAAARRQT